MGLATARPVPLAPPATGPIAGVPAGRVVAVLLRLGVAGSQGFALCRAIATSEGTINSLPHRH